MGYFDPDFIYTVGYVAVLHIYGSSSLLLVIQKPVGANIVRPFNLRANNVRPYISLFVLIKKHQEKPIPAPDYN